MPFLNMNQRSQRDRGHSSKRGTRRVIYRLFNAALRPQIPYRLLGPGSPGLPPRLSHNSCDTEPAIPTELTSSLYPNSSCVHLDKWSKQNNLKWSKKITYVRTHALNCAHPRSFFEMLNLGSLRVLCKER